MDNQIWPRPKKIFCGSQCVCILGRKLGQICVLILFFFCNFVSALHSFSHLYPPPPYPSRNHYAIWLRVNDKLCHLSMQQNTCFILKKICHKYNSKCLLMVFNEFFLIIFSWGFQAQHLTQSVVCVMCHMCVVCGVPWMDAIL